MKRPSKKIREKFLKDFTSELIEARSEQIMKDLKSQEQKIRVKRAKDVEKLKNKYIKSKLIKKPVVKKTVKKAVKKKSAVKKKPVPRKRLPRPVPVTQQLAPLNVRGPRLELGKLNELIADPTVQSIECPGPGKLLILKKNNPTMKSKIKLTKAEITHVVTEFSEKARIPLMEGMLRARVGNLQVSAVVSKLTSSRFIITRIYAPVPNKLPAVQPQPVQMMPGATMPARPLGLPLRRPMPPVRRPFMPGASPRPMGRPPMGRPPAGMGRPRRPRRLR